MKPVLLFVAFMETTSINLSFYHVIARYHYASNFKAFENYNEDQHEMTIPFTQIPEQ
jgi:hypothetical protein